MMKRFAAWARVSTEQQEQQGHSLAVQESALKAYAQRLGGTVVKMFSVAESAQASEVRAEFRKMLEFVRVNVCRGSLDGLLIDRVDRASRNIYDGAALLELRDRYGLRILFVSQNIDLGTSDGEMLFTFLLGIARFEN